MGSPERVRRSTRHETEEDVEVNIDSVRDDDNWVLDDKHKSRSRRSVSGEDVDSMDYSGRKRRHENRKRLGGSSSSRADSDQDDYETRKDLRCSKQVKKKPEENTLDVLSTWYQDGEAENKAGSRGHSQADESERNNLSSKYSEKHNVDAEKMPSREKGSGYAEQGKKNRRRWDEPDNIDAPVDLGVKSDARSGKPLHPKSNSASERERGDPLETYELNDDKDNFFDSITDKGLKSHEKERTQLDSDRDSTGRFEIVVENSKGSLTNEDISSKERPEDHRQQRNPTRETVDGHTRSSNADESVNTWMRDKSRRDAQNPMSRTPERIGRRQSESGKDGSWDDRSKGRDDSWADRNRDRERDTVKDSWKRKQDKETRDGEANYDSMRDWELQRSGRDRIDGRLSGRKDGSRTEAVKTSSKYGISSENYDVIEIQTKPFDYVNDNSTTISARNGEVFQQSDMKPAPDPEERSRNTQGSAHSGEEIKDDQHSWRDDNNDFQVEKPRGQKGITPGLATGGQSSSCGSLPPLGNQDLGPFNRIGSQAARGNNRMGRVGRGRPSGRDSPMPMVGSTFGPLGLPPPGSLQSLPPNMSPTPGPISPGVFIPSFQPPIVWSEARGVEMNMLGVPSGFPPGPLGPRYPPNIGNAPSGAMGFSPSGPGRGMPPSMCSPNFNTMGRGQPQEKGWIPPRSSVPLGKAPSRGEQNDYSQNFVDTGTRPQNFIRELELTSVVEDYPKLRELIQKKDEIVANSSSPPMFHQCDLKEQVLSPEFFGTKFDVILVDPPWEEYVHRAPGVTDHMNYWTFEEIMNLKIEAIADTPSFIFLWVGDGVGLEQGRQCLKKWGFRRCEDICWVKTNKSNATPGLRHDSHTLFQRSKEHCLMGIKGTVRRSTDGHIIHANIDTDVIIAEEYPKGSTRKPEDMHRIVEHFALGRRRLELFGEDHNIRSGWLTLGNKLSSSNFYSEAYIRNFADKDGKMWLGGGGRNPPPEAPHLVLTTPDIESLRPKSPMKNQQQMQQQSATISLTTPSSSNKRPDNLPQNHNFPNLNLEASSSNMPSPAPWASSMEAFKGLEGGHLPPGYGYNGTFGPVGGEFLDYEPHRGMNMQGN